MQEIPKVRSNLQILFSGNCGSGSIGHWIRSYYNGITINICNSLNHNFLKPQHELYLGKLCPWKPKVTFHLVQQQTNMRDCGLYAIAFTTSICFGDKPDKIIYDESKFRTCIAKMLSENKIERLPQK